MMPLKVISGNDIKLNYSTDDLLTSPHFSVQTEAAVRFQSQRPVYSRTDPYRWLSKH